jgi:hypothetical protein
VHNSATNDEIVGGYFEVEFAFGEFDFCEFDSRPCVGKIDYRACKTPAVIQDDLGWFKYLPPPELPSLWLLLYRQIALDRKSFCCTNLHTPEEYNFLCYLPTFSCCIRISCYSVLFPNTFQLSKELSFWSRDSWGAADVRTNRGAAEY